MSTPTAGASYPKIFLKSFPPTTPPPHCSSGLLSLKVLTLVLLFEHCNFAFQRYPTLPETQLLPSANLPTPLHHHVCKWESAPPQLPFECCPSLTHILALYQQSFYIENKNVGNKESSEDWRSEYNVQSALSPFVQLEFCLLITKSLLSSPRLQPPHTTRPPPT